MNDRYRGNKTITAGELKAFLNDFPEDAEVVFNVDVDPSSSFYHAEQLEAGLKGDAWMNLTRKPRKQWRTMLFFTNKKEK